MSGWISWKTGIQGNLQSVDKIKEIDSDMIKTLWVSTDFVKFVYLFCARIGHDMRSFMKTLAQEDSDIFEDSDIAWGVTTYINNKEYWDMLIREEDGVGNAGSNDKGDSSSPEGEKEVEVRRRGNTGRW